MDSHQSYIYNHVDKLRERLWCGREFGRVAVMIGAGFSRNADRFSSNGPIFPLWWDIISAMHKELYFSASEMSSPDPLRLALEYEREFNRVSLDEFLLKTIPDNEYTPGTLHHLLLSLPWSDVFTTNYDTLLERTLPRVHDRKYDLVFTASDIPGKMKPRLVKLHGSFPSIRPFIITEDDYRTYPSKFGPFVNMVQQSIMENDFCLIGFSANDPNFLHWTGWVRDNLGDSTPNIYLVGLLNLSPPQIKVLEARNVIPLDLSPLFPANRFPDSATRHSKATEWFLIALSDGRPPNNLSWPDISVTTRWQRSDDLPEVPPPPLKGSIPRNIFHTGLGPLSKEMIQSLLEAWQETRTSYPGWVVAPRNNRQKIFEWTRNWIPTIIQNVLTVEAPSDIALLYELCWRLDVALCYLDDELGKAVENIINKYNPYPSIINVKATVMPNSDGCRYNWDVLRDEWVYLVFLLMRTAREKTDKVNFEKWSDLIRPVIHHRSEWNARWFYEYCLLYLIQGDRQRVLTLLNEWQKTVHLPFWNVKRAAIMAEIGEIDAAASVAQDALTQIRVLIKSNCTDYFLLSMEGWAITLLDLVRQSSGSDNAMPNIEHYRDRLEQLAQWRCNPWLEIEAAERAVASSQPIAIAGHRTIRPGFDPGIMTISETFGSRLPEYLLAVVGCLRLIEEGGFPVKCGHVDSFASAAFNAAERLAPYDSSIALNVMCRTGRVQNFEKWFDRVRAATMSDGDVDHFYNMCMASIRQAIKEIGNRLDVLFHRTTSFLWDKILFASEFLSMLCFRLSPEQVNNTLDLIILMYRSSAVQRFFPCHKALNVLFRRVMSAITDEGLLGRIDKLLALPIVEATTDFEVNPQMWPEPFGYIIAKGAKEVGTCPKDLALASAVSNLVRIARAGTVEARKRAVVRLAALYSFEWLDESEKQLFAEALWARVDEGDGVPKDTGLEPWSFLALPEVTSGQAKESLRRYFHDGRFESIEVSYRDASGTERRGIPMGVLSTGYAHSLVKVTPSLLGETRPPGEYIEWSVEEVRHFADKLLMWWAETKIIVGEPTNLKDSIVRRLCFLVDAILPVILQVISPNLKDEDLDLIVRIKGMVFELGEYGCNIQSILPWFIFRDLLSSGEVARVLRMSLNSTIDSAVQGSVNGIFNWFVIAKREGSDSVPTDLLNELVNRVAMRRQPFLDISMVFLVNCLKYLPELITREHIDLLLVGLEYLVSETALPNDLERIELQGGIIDVLDRPRYRQLSAELAYRIFTMYYESAEAVPDAISQWREICAADALSEVRSVWGS